MDPNNPNNNPNPSGFIPTTPPADTNTPPPAPAGPTNEIIADVTQLPADAPASTPLQPASPWGAPVATQQPTPATSPWESSAPATPANPALPPTATPLPESPWGPPAQLATTAADVPTAPAAPTPPAEGASNPFLQPQSGASFSVPQTAFDQPSQGVPLPSSDATVPNPMASQTSDPLNTAFSPTGSLPQNPFNQTAQTPPAPASSPWGSSVPATPENTAPTPPPPAPGSEQPNTAPETPAMTDTTASTNSAQGTLDLSSLQNQSATNISQAQNAQTPPADQPVAPPQGSDASTSQNNAPENAPTDLSHLIASDESQNSQSMPMGNVYTPPVAQDQTAGVGLPQITQPDSSSGAPPAKHLNLTKVLLVAGIPIILIVAALSAYLILGVGKSAPKDTSLPVEQTPSTQAPLTNPPQQIVAPSPDIIPEPGTTDSAASAPPVSDPFPNSSPPPIDAPAASTPGSAMDRLRARQASSPATSTAPAASDGTSLPQ